MGRNVARPGWYPAHGWLQYWDGATWTEDRRELPQEGASKNERIYQGTPDQIFQAALQAVAELEHSIVHSDAQSHAISFNTGMSMSSWAGQDMSVQIFAQDQWRSRVVAGGHRAQRGNPFGGGGQLVSWGEKGRMIQNFFATLDRYSGGPSAAQQQVAVQSAPAEQATPSQGEPSTVSELERLVGLKQQGYLSDEEFQAAKNRLLGWGG